MNANQYRTMRRDFLRLARMAGRDCTVSKSFRKAYRLMAERMANLYPLTLEDSLEAYNVLCATRRNDLRAKVRAEIEKVTA